MNISNKYIKKYYQQLVSLIYQYAYENAESEPLIERKKITNWKNTIYSTANMENDLHKDIIEDLKETGMYYTVKAKYDSYVILPDIFSVRDYPLYRKRNEFDSGLRNIIMINGDILELRQTYYGHAYYNHNGKYYYWFNYDELGDMFTKGNDLEMVIVSDLGYIYDKMAWNWWEDKRLHLNIGPDGRVIRIITGTLGAGKLGHTAILGASPTAIDYIGISFMAPFIEFKYGELVDPEIYINVPGLMSFTEDGWVMEHLYGFDDNTIYIHNDDVLFTNTAIIIFKDGTWVVDNFQYGGKYVNKIDKHTVTMEKFEGHENIDRIYVFTKPFEYNKYIRVDSIYKKCMKRNPKAFLGMKPFRKTTTQLCSMMENKDMSLDELIEYGYKYDLDVLKVIQNFFRLVHDIDLKSVEILKEFEGNKFYSPKWKLYAFNRMDMFPVLFINNKMISSDIKVLKHGDADIILFDPLEIIREYVKEFNYNDMKWYTKKTDIEWNKEIFNKYVEDIKVVFVPCRKLDNGVFQDPRLYRSPIYRNQLIYDRYNSNNSDSNNYVSSMFVNGRLNNETFIYDENNVAVSKDLLRSLDGIERFDYDENKVTFENTLKPNKSNIYHPNFTLSDGTYSIYENEMDLSLLINRMDEELEGITRVYLGNKRFTSRYNNEMNNLQEVEGFKLKEYSTVVFDKYGYLANDLVDVLSGSYINLTNMYNYEHNDELTDDVVCHAFSLTLENPITGLNIEIDESRIDKTFNAGSFNDNCMKSESIRGLFRPNEVPGIRKTPIKLKSIEKLYGEKVITKYYLSTLNNPYNRERFNKEIGVFNGKYIISNTLGSIPDINNDFISVGRDDRFGEFNHSLNTLYASEVAIYNMFCNSTLASDGWFTVDDSYIDCNKRDYIANIDIINSHYLASNSNSCSINMNINLFPQGYKGGSY